MNLVLSAAFEDGACVPAYWTLYHGRVGGFESKPLAEPLLLLHPETETTFFIQENMPPRDEFYQARSQFQVGAFQAAINTLNSLASGAQEIKLMLLYRCYLAQKKQSIVLSELGSITSASPAELQAVKLLAEIQSQPGHNNTLTSKLRDLAHGNQSNGPVCYIAAEVFASSGQLEEAMRILHPIVDIDLDW